MAVVFLILQTPIIAHSFKLLLYGTSARQFLPFWNVCENYAHV